MALSNEFLILMSVNVPNAYSPGDTFQSVEHLMFYRFYKNFIDDSATTIYVLITGSCSNTLSDDN